jgi:hypothetical protein
MVMLLLEASVAGHILLNEHWMQVEVGRTTKFGLG